MKNFKFPLATPSKVLLMIVPSVICICERQDEIMISTPTAGVKDTNEPVVAESTLTASPTAIRKSTRLHLEIYRHELD
mgnify:CR=1 FL=1